MTQDRRIYVSLQLGKEIVHVGTLWCRAQSASFEFTGEWQGHREFFPLRPAFPMNFHTSERMFASLGDSAPDRWGRDLMIHAERHRARMAGENPRTLTEIDYLLGVNDEARQGAMRFSESLAGPYITSGGKRNIPPLVNLAELQAANQKYLDKKEMADDIKLLFDHGTSLGGARPKASVRDKDKHLAIAKFPKDDDTVNVVVWEAVALSLAKKAGLDVAQARVEKVSKLGNKAVLIVRRFDRRGDGSRIPFLSAMAMLDAKDHDDQHGYVDIALALGQYGSRPKADLQELWRRVVFNVLISNRDDHLRNHAFLYEGEKGWRLSPVYDVNPSPFMVKARMLESASLDNALAVAAEFGIDNTRAKDISREVAAVVKNWRAIAKQHGLVGREIDSMAAAFDHTDLKQALA